MLIFGGICTKKIGAISQLGAEKITFPPKPDGHTDRHTVRQTDRRADICFYRVALLLKRERGMNRDNRTIFKSIKNHYIKNKI